MRRLEVRFSELALGDLAEIVEYIASESSPLAAERYLGEIMAACERIADAPDGGRRRDDLRPGLRSWAMPKRAVILYAIEGGAVRIAGIFPRGRSVDARYRNPRTFIE